jgi:hypothetical protein
MNFENHKKKEAVATKVRQFIGHASKIAGVIVRLRDKPNIFDWIAVGLTATDIFYAIAEQFAENKFDINSFFDSPYSNQAWTRLDRFTEKAVKKFGTNEQRISVESDYQELVMVEISGMPVGWLQGKKDPGNRWNFKGPFCLRGDKSKIRKALSNTMWEIVGSNACHIKYQIIKEGISKSESEIVIEDDIFKDDIHMSKQTGEIIERIKLFNDKGHPRSYILDGPPGTGKSTAIRTIAAKLGLKSVRVSTRQIFREGGSDSLQAIVETLRPEIIILDDLDRVHSPWDLLESLESYRKFCPILIATSNNIKRLTGACIRPGRLDEIIEFNQMDKDVIIKILGEDCKDILDKVIDWPIAYINDFALRKSVVGKEQAVSEMEELRNRIKKISQAADKGDYDKTWLF